MAKSSFYSFASIACFVFLANSGPIMAHSADSAATPRPVLPAQPEEFEDFADMDGIDISAPFKPEDPSRTIEGLTARANDWREPSARSEARYVLAMRRWLSALDSQVRERARQILKDSHPGLKALRVAIREKKSQLASLSINSNTRPDTLPRLGKELQDLRATLRRNLEMVNERLKRETGLSLEPIGGDGFWLLPAQAHKKQPHSQSLTLPTTEIWVSQS